MKVKIVCKTLVAGAGLFLASSVFALPIVKITQNTPYVGTPDQGGGEFWANTSANGTFLTFCLEKDVHVSMGVPYYYTVENTVKGGGGGAVGGMDNISSGTAWLYDSFLNNTLLDSDGVGLYGEHRELNAGLLQLAIWSLEDEIAWDASNYYLNLVGVGAKADYTGNSIKAMNLWLNSDGTGDRQSVLHRVPDGAMTSVLLGLGLISLAVFRRKL